MITRPASWFEKAGWATAEAAYAMITDTAASAGQRGRMRNATVTGTRTYAKRAFEKGPPESAVSAVKNAMSRIVDIAANPSPVCRVDVHVSEITAHAPKRPSVE